MFSRIVLAMKLAIILMIIAFLHYNLPDRDIVRVVGTDVTRVDQQKGVLGAGQPDAGRDNLPNRDVRYINTKRANGKAMVYRNQDTNLGWPPYFKFDTSNITADAQDLVLRYQSNEEIWVAVRHYGWRIEFLSLFPNAISIKEVDGPHVTLIPWFNIVFLIFVGLILLWIIRFFGRVKKKRLDPIADKIGDTSEAVGDEIAEKKSAVSGFFRKWFGTSKKQ